MSNFAFICPYQLSTLKKNVTFRQLFSRPGPCDPYMCYILKKLIPDFAFVSRKCLWFFQVLPQSSCHIQLMKLPISAICWLSDYLRTQSRHPQDNLQIHKGQAPLLQPTKVELGLQGKVEWSLTTLTIRKKSLKHWLGHDDWVQVSKKICFDLWSWSTSIQCSRAHNFHGRERVSKGCMSVSNCYTFPHPVIGWHCSTLACY